MTLKGVLVALDYTSKDTIVALATPAGHGSISVIRLSGKNALNIIKMSCDFIPENPESHRAYYGIFRSSEDANRKIDEVIVTFFREGRSFSGENTFEISCHGSQYIVGQIIGSLLTAGARSAKPGEFTFRAFMNGRVDLVQAESVLSIIQSDSERSSRQALQQLGGRLSEEIESIEDDVIYCLAHLEASIDFSTEGLDTLDHKEIGARLSELVRKIERLIGTYKSGRAIKDGYNLALVGDPNVGKSSLLNTFLKEEKAIVTPIAGTTRDVVEGAFFINGYKVNAFDTAGFRETEDLVEKIGIQRSEQALAEADGVMIVVDLSSLKSLKANSIKELNLHRIIDISRKDQDIYIVGNKADLVLNDISSLEDLLLTELKNLQAFKSVSLAMVSAQSKSGIDELKTKIITSIESRTQEDHALISNTRHLECLRMALVAVNEAIRILSSSIGAEFVAIPLKEALLKLQDILGKHYDDQILDRVFKEFCLGK